MKKIGNELFDSLVYEKMSGKSEIVPITLS